MQTLIDLSGGGLTDADITQRLRQLDAPPSALYCQGIACIAVDSTHFSGNLGRQCCTKCSVE
jgi:hypothetical protein